MSGKPHGTRPESSPESGAEAWARAGRTFHIPSIRGIVASVDSGTVVDNHDPSSDPLHPSPVLRPAPVLCASECLTHKGLGR